MTANKRPSTSSLRRFISSRPYVAIAELRRRFILDQPDAMSRLERDGTVAWVGLPDREAAKLQELWLRDEIGLQLSVEVRAPVVVGIFPMRIARYVIDGIPLNGSNGHAPPDGVIGHPQVAPTDSHAFRPAARPPSYGNALGAPKPSAAHE
jgi:hypothetical protein